MPRTQPKGQLSRINQFISGAIQAFTSPGFTYYLPGENPPLHEKTKKGEELREELRMMFHFCCEETKFVELISYMKVLLTKPLGLLTFAIALGLVLPPLMMDGMFMDATMYTAVGNNLAHGYGSPWFLYYSVTHTTNVPGFFENPPLGYWLFAGFFKLFGDSLYVERFYVLLTYLFTMGLIIRLWNQVMERHRNIAWLPVLMWSIVPLSFWAYTHNMMENTMTIFVLLSIILGVKSATTQEKAYLWAGLGGICVFAAFMVKGFPGMYPLVSIAVYWMVYRNLSFKRMLSLSLTMAAFGVLPILLLFALPVTGDSLYNYLFIRTLDRVKYIPVVDNRFRIRWELLQQMILPVLTVSICGALHTVKNNNSLNLNTRAFWLLLVVGLCGVVPLCITKVQRGFYLIPAIPLVTMAMAVVVAHPVQYWQQKLGSAASRNICRISLGLVFVVIIYRYCVCCRYAQER